MLVPMNGTYKGKVPDWPWKQNRNETLTYFYKSIKNKINNILLNKAQQNLYSVTIPFYPVSVVMLISQICRDWLFNVFILFFKCSHGHPRGRGNYFSESIHMPLHATPGSNVIWLNIL